MCNINKLVKGIIICLGLTFFVSPASFADDTANKTNQPATQQKEPDVQYTGVYQDRQLIPNIMAIHCKMNAEDVAKDLNKIETCLRQYIKEINNKDLMVAQNGKKDYDTLLYGVLNDLLSASITKAAAVDGFEAEMKEHVDATGNKSDTKFSTETALANTIAFSTDIKNHLRDLYVESTKFTVIKNIGVITPEAFGDEDAEDVEPEKDEAKDAEKDKNTDK